jgi:hypothetical protein
MNLIGVSDSILEGIKNANVIDRSIGWIKESRRIGIR